MLGLASWVWVISGLLTLAFFLLLERAAIADEQGRHQLPEDVARILGLDPRSTLRRHIMPGALSVGAGLSLGFIPAAILSVIV